MAPASGSASVRSRLAQLSLLALVWAVASRYDAASWSRRLSHAALPEGVPEAWYSLVLVHAVVIACTIFRIVGRANSVANIDQGVVAMYVCALHVVNYYTLWSGQAHVLTGYPMVIFIPQRWLLHLFTVHQTLTLVKPPEFVKASGLKRFRPTVLLVGAAEACKAGCAMPDARLRAASFVVSATLMAAGLACLPSPLYEPRVRWRAWLLWALTVGSLLAGYCGVMLGPAAGLSAGSIEMLFAVQSGLTAVMLSLPVHQLAEKAEVPFNALHGEAVVTVLHHEVRSSLNSIIGLLELLKSGSVGPLTEKMSKVIDNMMMGIKRTLLVTSSFFEVDEKRAGVDDSAPPKKFCDVNVAQLLAGVLKLVEPLTPASVKLINNVEEMPAVSADPDVVAQVFYQILSNAVKFTRNGNVHVTSCVDAAASQIAVSITDTGCGMTHDHVCQLLEDGILASDGRSSIGQTGSSLQLVQALLATHFGRLEIQSEVGRGSAFTVWLPITQAGQKKGQVEERQRRRSQALQVMARTYNDRRYKMIALATSRDRLHNDNERNGNSGSHLNVRKFHQVKHGVPLILSVDDDPINQMVINDLLAHEGYKVEQRMSGQEALAFLSSSETLPDLILLDVMMPDMNGHQVCRAIRELFPSVSIPVIIVSARSDPEDVMQGLSSGSIDYVKKPYHRQEMLSRVRAQLRNRELIEAEVRTRKVVEHLKPLMPMSVIHRLEAGQSIIADAHSSVTVLVASRAHPSPGVQPQSQTAQTRAAMLEMEHSFEGILERHGVFRTHSDSDNFVVVSGQDGCGDHLNRVLALAEEMLLMYASEKNFPLRIGIHCGPAHAGVVGIDDPSYVVFGETVVSAESLAAHAPDGTIHVSRQVANGTTRELSFEPLLDGLLIGSSALETLVAQVGEWQDALKAYQERQLHGTTPAHAAVAASSDALAAARTKADVLRSQLAAERAATAAADARAAAAEQAAAAERAVAADRVAAANRVAAAAAASERAAASAAHPPPTSSGRAAGGSGGGGSGSGLSVLVSASELPAHGYLPHSPTESVVSRTTVTSGMVWAGPALLSLEAFLGDLGLAQHLPTLAKQELTPLILAKMTHAQLQSIGVSAFGARKRILEAAADYHMRMESATRLALMHSDAAAHTRGAASRRSHAPSVQNG